MKKLAIVMIRIYQRTISRWVPDTCRYIPTCSQYTLEAIQRFGVIKGIFMVMKRIARCHPWHEGGYDPVPEKIERK